MTKTCPNCGVNSPDNAKHCIECGENIEDVPINKVKEPTVKSKTSTNTDSDSSGDNSWIGCIILIAIVAIVIVGAGFFIFSGSNESSQQNITITFDQVYASDYMSSGKPHYSYTVSGFINNFPDDLNGYLVKTIYYDAKGNELTSKTEKLSYFESNKNSKYAATLSSYYTENYIDVDHVTVQILKDNNVLNEFTSPMNKNKLTTVSGSSSNMNTSSNLSNLSK